LATHDLLYASSTGTDSGRRGKRTRISVPIPT
jgi:hypothetical protein